MWLSAVTCPVQYGSCKCMFLQIVVCFAMHACTVKVTLPLEYFQYHSAILY